jgi:inner membrane protease ATP23
MFTGLGLSDDEKADREKMEEQKTLARDWDRCEKWKKGLMESSKYK